MVRDADATEVRVTPAPPRAESRFTPGAMVADRYRIVSLLGGGGMGEVYRADDLKLGQRVALKYVPTHDATALERLYSEVRVGRQIAHPNVCRLYDLIEVGDQHFITMEYVDGEDLASLLRRIGRLPVDKALALARDLCAGLAAAHDRGFVHRDLKPANVMVDGRGNARITDFGLSGLAEELMSAGGTPTYMAPEQLDHSVTTIRSDLYALGLVLFEMFTGRRVFDAQTMSELRAQHTMTKTRPRSIVQEIDPAVEQAILRCLDEDPSLRPASAHEVLAALPGGDPLRAAVAEGKTPSPEMVAAAGRTGELSTSRAWALLLLALALFAVVALVRPLNEVSSRMREVKPPDALRDRARSILAAAGYERAPHASGRFMKNSRYVRAQPRRAPLGAAATPFLYRDSPRPIVPVNENGWVLGNDPPLIVPGMSWVLLDAEGKLLELRRVAPQRTPSASRAVPWSAMFGEAGLDAKEFRADTPQWTAPVPSDARAAWIRDRDALRVEAASVAGQPVWFAVLPRGGTPFPDVPLPKTAPGMPQLIATLLIAGIFFARRNVVRGAADRRGALRVAAFCGVTAFIGWASVARHHAHPGNEWSLLATLAGNALFFAATAWIWYLAIEPYFRRRWPHMLIGWTRVLNGRLRDPLVGTELLLGLAAGATGMLLTDACDLLLGGFDQRNSLTVASMQTFLGVLHPLLRSASTAVSYALAGATLLLLLRLVLRKTIAAWIGTWAVCVVAGSLSFTLGNVLANMFFIAAVLLAFRFGGLFAAASAFFVNYAVHFGALTLSPDSWYFGRSTLLLLALAALAVHGFLASNAGKPLLGGLALEDEAAA